MPLQRRGGWLLLAGVVLVHVLGVNELLLDRFGWGAGSQSVRRIEVAFVRELAPAAPPAPAARAPAAVAGRKALPAVAAAASAPAPVAEAIAEPAPRPPAVPEVVAAEPPAPEPAPPPALAQAAATPPDPSPAASSPPPEPVAPVQPPESALSFDWPPSTRMSYLMTGNFRGPIEGRAQVDWLRSGTRYQVHLETSVAPLLTRRITSEGELTERGLAPRRFEGEQRVLMRAPRRWSLQFGPERIVLADGREVDTLPGAQDEASQFVQLTWLFTTQPQLLQVGRSIEVPLALNRRLDLWIYDVKEVQQLRLPYGTVETYYVKPRREAKGGDMTAEIWFAPSLQYLPVRILIRQDEATYVDLVLEKPPLQAATR